MDMKPISNERAAEGFAAAGSTARLAVLRQLVRAGDDGLPIGEIGDKLGIPLTTLAHHLKTLAAAGLIEQDRQGRSVINRAKFDHIKALAAFLLEECCADQLNKHRDHNHDRDRQGNLAERSAA